MHEYSQLAFSQLLLNRFLDILEESSITHGPRKPTFSSRKTRLHYLKRHEGALANSKHQSPDDEPRHRSPQSVEHKHYAFEPTPLNQVNGTVIDANIRQAHCAIAKWQ